MRPMPRRHWLLKSEPFKYPWDRFVDEGQTFWDGVRNFEARNNMRAMRVGELALFYHSNEGKAIVGIARVVREAYPDPTAEGADWSAVDFVPVAPIVRPVTLEAARSDRLLSRMALIRRSRLSVAPVEADEFTRVLALGETRLPRVRTA